jgi:RHH-type proline utilization regulon transcriptional repressor/proline dehydrogenase/delta 1-pyrroline-5-carboxylate dehydrogenase
MLPDDPPADAVRNAFLAAESETVTKLLPLAAFSDDASMRVCARAHGWVQGLRARRARSVAMESFLREYDLSTQEGVLLMCVAEALPLPRD